jgi:hypothetical protein
MATVDRRLAQLIAYKRIVTGSLALAGGCATVAIAAVHGGPPSPLVPLAMAIFFGGGAWALRDGIRLQRELRKPSST